MDKRLIFKGPREVGFEEYEEKKPGDKEVKLQTLFTGISSGTEMNVYRGAAPFYNKKFDADKKLFIDSEQGQWKYPMAYGYEHVGKVIEAGRDVSALKKGDIVATQANHRTTAIVHENYAFKLPEGVAPEIGVFMSPLRITYNGILDADIHLGDTVAIFGQGTMGLIMTQLVKLSGGNVIAIDFIDRRLQIAKKFGTLTINPKEVKDVALEIRNLTGNRGADTAIELTGSTKALNEAVRTVCARGTVISMGWYPGEAKGLYLGEEFHHNWVNIKCSQIGNVNPSLSMRWTMQRRDEFVMELLPRLSLKELTTHVYDFNEAAKAYEIVDKHPEEIIQVVLKYS